jgi:hypothetical protein
VKSGAAHPGLDAWPLWILVWMTPLGCFRGDWQGFENFFFSSLPNPEKSRYHSQKLPRSLQDVLCKPIIRKQQRLLAQNDRNGLKIRPGSIQGTEKKDEPWAGKDNTGTVQCTGLHLSRQVMALLDAVGWRHCSCFERAAEGSSAVGWALICACNNGLCQSCSEWVWIPVT